MARYSTRQDEQDLLVVRIARKSYSAAADGDALAEGRVAEGLKLALFLLR